MTTSETVARAMPTGEASGSAPATSARTDSNPTDPARARGDGDHRLDDVVRDRGAGEQLRAAPEPGPGVGVRRRTRGRHPRSTEQTSPDECAMTSPSDRNTPLGYQA